VDIENRTVGIEGSIERRDGWRVSQSLISSPMLSNASAIRSGMVNTVGPVSTR